MGATFGAFLPSSAAVRARAAHNALTTPRTSLGALLTLCAVCVAQVRAAAVASASSPLALAMRQMGTMGLVAVLASNSVKARDSYLTPRNPLPNPWPKPDQRGPCAPASRSQALCRVANDMESAMTRSLEEKDEKAQAAADTAAVAAADCAWIHGSPTEDACTLVRITLESLTILHY